MNINEMWAKFKIQSRTIKDFSHWLVVVRPKQVTLGSCLFLAKRPVDSLGGLTRREAKELPKVAAWFEEQAKEIFQAERFNYVVAMMKDPYLHFHAFPRYSGDRERFGIIWKDEAWPSVVEFANIETPDDVLDSICDLLKGAPK